MLFILSKYKIPLLLTLLVSVYLILFKFDSNLMNYGYTLLGGLLGMIFLDLDPIFYAIFINPKDEKSLEIIGYIKSRKFISYLKNVDTYKKEIKDLMLHTSSFQVLVILVAFYVVVIESKVFAQSFLLALYINMIYAQAYEYSLYRNLDNWLKFASPSKKEFTKIYLFLITAVFIYLISLL